MSDRRIPGMPPGFNILVADDWLRAEVEVSNTPPSMNENAIRSHWRGFHEQKKVWQQSIETLLMAARVPRGNQRAIAGAILTFPRRAARRDSGNFSGLIEKALGDALVNGGWIPDDNDAHYSFLGVEFNPEKGPARTQVVVFMQPKEA